MSGEPKITKELSLFQRNSANTTKTYQR